MLNPHTALAVMHLAITAILHSHGAFAEAICLVIVSAIYAAMPPSGH